MMVTDTFGTLESYAERRTRRWLAAVGAVGWMVLASLPLSAQSQTPPPAQAATFKWDDHPRLSIGKDFHIDFRARLRADLKRSEVPFENDEDALDIPRRRVGVDGAFGDIIAFQVEHEFDSDDPWRDVYAEYRFSTALRVRGGKFKVPFSLDENTSGSELDFTYRSLAANQIAPGRDRGVMVHGRLWDRALNYEVGVFAHGGDHVQARKIDQVESSRMIAARVSTEPLSRKRTARTVLYLAAAFTQGDLAEGISPLRGRTALQTVFFPSDFWVNGPRRRLGVEASWMSGPFSLKSEYMRTTEARLGQSVFDTDLDALTSHGWYASGTWALTGERKSRGLDRPNRPFLQGGPGAIELAGRIEELTLGGGTSTEEGPSTSPRAMAISANRDRAITAGVNWYLNRWIKVQGDVIHETLLDPSRGPDASRPSFWSRVLRVQFTL